MPSEPQPICRDSSRASQYVREPLVVTPILAPLRSSGFRMAEDGPTINPMLSGWLASAPTAFAGTPLARNPMAGPEPRPKSTDFATSPCCNLASPAKITTSTSSPCFAQMPFSVPISTGAKANGWLTDLPTRTLSAAVAAAAPRRAAASSNPAIIRWHSRRKSRPRCRRKCPPKSLSRRFRFVMIAPPRQSAKLAQEFDDLFVRHVFAHVVAIVVHDIFERTAHARPPLHRRKTHRDDVMDHDEVGHAQNTLERLLDVDGDVLRAEPQ